MSRSAICLAWLVALPLSAAEVGTLNTFTAGTPAKAAEVNKNFEDVKTAVNENYQRLVTEENNSTTQATQISNLQSGKQNQLTGSCAVGTTITSFNNDGSFNCTPALFGGVTSVGSASFVHQNDSELRFGQCNINRTNYLTVGGSAYSCELYAALDLPHSAKLVSMTCNTYDNLAGSPASVSVALQRTELFDDGPHDLLNVTTAAGASVFVQTLTDNTVVPGLFTDIIDNGFYAYRLKLTFQSDEVGLVDFTNMAHKLRFFGCQVSYVAQPDGVPEH